MTAVIEPTDFACSAYVELERLAAEITERETITSFRAYLISTSGPGVGGNYKLILGTDARHKDALWELTNHLGEFFEIEIHRVRVIAGPRVLTQTYTPPEWKTERVNGAIVPTA